MIQLFLKNPAQCPARCEEGKTACCILFNKEIFNLNISKMKRVKLNKHQIGLVFRDEQYLGFLLEGRHWLRWGTYMMTYQLTEAFDPPCDLNILLEDEQLRAHMELVEVMDHELCIVSREGLFEKVLEAGRHVYWKSLINYTFQMVDLREIEVAPSLSTKLLQQPSLLRHQRIFVIEPYEEGLLLIDGLYDRKLMPGTHRFWLNGQSLQLLKADLRTQQMEISGQEILTKDKAGIRINFYLQYQVTDIEKALLKSKDTSKQLYLMIQMAIREYVGTLTLDELLAKKQEVKDYVRDKAAQGASGLGVRVDECGIRDIILPGEVREIMNQVLIAEKKAQANTILRREETASTRSLMNTAKLMEDNTMLYRLKEMEYLEKIADKVSNISLSGGSQVLGQLRALFVNDESER
jgi:regulator of protease activity HflC (stomatin/prohibitin superfamily)